MIFAWEKSPLTLSRLASIIFTPAALDIGTVATRCAQCDERIQCPTRASMPLKGTWRLWKRCPVVLWTVEIGMGWRPLFWPFAMDMLKLQCGQSKSVKIIWSTRLQLEKPWKRGTLTYLKPSNRRLLDTKEIDFWWKALRHYWWQVGLITSRNSKNWKQCLTKIPWSRQPKWQVPRYSKSCWPTSVGMEQVYFRMIKCITIRMRPRLIGLRRLKQICGSVGRKNGPFGSLECLGWGRRWL